MICSFCSLGSPGAKRDGYKIAELQIWKAENPDNKRVVKHFWFDTWPDYGVPKDGLVLPKMLKAIREWNNVDHQPCTLPSVLHDSVSVTQFFFNG